MPFLPTPWRKFYQGNIDEPVQVIVNISGIHPCLDIPAAFPYPSPCLGVYGGVNTNSSGG
jgi:hypothetical protein